MPEREPPPTSIRNLLNPRKVVVQLVFWLIGVGLLIWIIIRAIETGDWGKIAAADPLWIAVLLGGTVVSLAVNGASFWITVQSVRRVSFIDVQMVNAVSHMLNYAPVRLGGIARIAFHYRVDRLSLLQLAAWFSVVGYVLGLTVASCLVATLIHDSFDWIWVLLVLGQIVAGIIAMQVMVSHRLIREHGRGIDTLFHDARGVWGAVALRLTDIAAVTCRMAAALHILEIHLPASHMIVLAIVALAAGLIPFGRVGFREFCIAVAGAHLGALSSDEAVPWEQLALIESAGEAVIFIPAGAVGLIWYYRRWRESANAA
jgi:hypothetical protein